MITQVLSIFCLVFALGTISGSSRLASEGGSPSKEQGSFVEQLPVGGTVRAVSQKVKGAGDCPLHADKFKQLRNLGLISTNAKQCTCPHEEISSLARRSVVDDEDENIVEESESEEAVSEDEIDTEDNDSTSNPRGQQAVQPVVEEEEEAESGITAFEDAVRAGVVKNLTVDARRGDNILDINCCDSLGNPRAVDVVGAIALNAVDSDLTVNYLRDSVFQSGTDRTRLRGDGREASVMRLYAAKGRTITFNLDRNLTFKGRTVDGRVLDLVLVIAGQGRVVFNVADGKTLKFTGDIDEAGAVTLPADRAASPVRVNNLNNRAGGTKVLITMEQTKEDFDNGVDKVVFQRKNYAKEEHRSLIFVGPNSLVTFVSDDPSGVRHEAKPAIGGFASVGFDVSNKGTGRMVLFIRGAYNFVADSTQEALRINKVFPFNDGAVVVAGHKVDDYTVDGIVGGLNYSVPAGGQARIRVTDDKAYAARANDASYDPQLQDRRGLLVINDAQSVSSRAADPYLDFFQECGGRQVEAEEEEIGGTDDADEALFRSPRPKVVKARRVRRDAQIASSTEPLRQIAVDEPDTRFVAQWAYSAGLSKDLHTKNVRTGFVLGVNGVVDINHATFLDYVAGSVNRANWVVRADQQDAEEGVDSLLMPKNPSAFVADGLDALLFHNGCSAFKAANPLTQANPRHAQMVLRGDAQALFRCAASASLGYIREFWKGDDALRRPTRSANVDEEGQEELASVDEDEVDRSIEDRGQSFTESLIAATTRFDGVRLTDSQDTTEKGQNVLEVEGLFTIKSAPNTSTKDGATGQARLYARTIDRAGRVVTPTLQVDHTGSELVARPLIPDDMYARYESPRLFLNNHLTLDGVTWLHSDVTKAVTGIPTESTPALVGGERLRFAQALVTSDGSDRDRWRFPELRLRNAEVALVESLAVAGVRVVVSDDATHQDNRSTLRFIDQNRELGNVFMLGSQVATPLDGTTSDWMSASAYVNVFRSNVTPGVRSGVVELALAGGVLDQTKPGSGVIDTRVFGNDQHHVVIASLDQGAANVTVGSSELVGQVGSRGYPYQNTRYNDKLLAELPAAEAEANQQFSLDTKDVPAARMVINRNNITFESLDHNGHGPVVPVRRWDASGVVNVGHGGRLEIAHQGRAGVASAVFNTNVVTRVTSDGDKQAASLNGQAVLPVSAATFGHGFGVQMFGLEEAKKGLVFLGAAYADQRSRSGILQLGSVNLDWAPQLAQPASADGTQARVMRASRARAHKFAQTRRNEKSAPVVTRAVPGSQHPEPVSHPQTAAAVGAGQEVRQLVVFGATAAQPCEVVVTGGAAHESAGRVHEFVTGQRTNEQAGDGVLGEGAHARIYMSQSGRVGLGSTSVNSASSHAWSTLGRTAVQLAPLGDGVVQVNADLLVVDPYALVAGTTFGQNGVNSLTFTSDKSVEVRIPSGVELDLSSFGRSSYQQQLVFSGNVRLVFEKGAGLRFPSADAVKGVGLVLQIKDQAQLVFEGEEHAAQAGLKSPAAVSSDRVKLFGKGQIVLSGQATMTVGSQAAVGVQADRYTAHTDVTVGVQDQAHVEVGTLTQAGGSFEVGNPVNVDNTSIDFTLQLQGNNAEFTVGKNAFVGLAAGVVARSTGAPNGRAAAHLNPVIDRGIALQDGAAPRFTPDATQAWQVQPLRNVNTVSVSVAQGALNHQVIADGSSSDASLFAVGQAGSFSLHVGGSGQALVRGGGNMMFVPAGSGTVSANVWDFAGELQGGERYSVMGVTPAIVSRLRGTSGLTSPASFFDALATENFKTQHVKALPALTTGDRGDVTVAFVNGDDGSKYAAGQLRITRAQHVQLQPSRSGTTKVTRGGVVGLDATQKGPFVFGTLG